MNHLYLFCLLAPVAGMVIPAVAQSPKESVLAHTHAAFRFTVAASYAEVFPLFGAHEERKWAKGFDPQFLYPVPAHDQQGMVFTTVQDGLSRIWTNTCFDAATGHVQYVYWIADVMTAFIDIHLTSSGPRETLVEVVYERTALTLEANERVFEMARHDAISGPHWAEMINAVLQKRP
jgi:hypothetical protein